MKSFDPSTEIVGNCTKKQKEDDEEPLGNTHIHTLTTRSHTYYIE